jgi:ribosome biogenesis SPOUT family RNA methylase Rps3
MLYIIGHLEEKLYRWCFLEYQQISKLVGKENLLFTNIKSAVQGKKLHSFGRVESKSVRQLASLKNSKSLYTLKIPPLY